MKTIKGIIQQSGINFGTSGARGLVMDFTSEVCTALTLSFLDTMKKSFTFKKVAVAMDNRLNSFDIASFICGYIEAYGFKVVFYGVLRTLALVLQSMKDKIPSIMITDSHIAFDRNGIKFYTPLGEISKEDESDILNNSNPMIDTSSNLHQTKNNAGDIYLNRYKSYFVENCLNGLKFGIYEHSSWGRDLYAKLFASLEASVTILGRSDEFVLIDTEAVSIEDKNRGKIWSKDYKFDAIFSSDGDGNRPLIADENGDWFRGDIVGLLTSQFLAIEALAVPVRCNTAIEKSNSFKVVVRSKISSPYFIEAFDNLKDHKSFAGFEANGGFILDSTLNKDGNTLDALPTRDALFPFIVLASHIVKNKTTLPILAQNLPHRFTSSDRIQEFPIENSLKLIEQGLSNPSAILKQFGLGNQKVIEVNTTDGLRLTLEDNNIIHLRLSGNTPELRCYVETNGQDLSDNLAKKVLSYIKKIILRVDLKMVKNKYKCY